MVPFPLTHEQIDERRDKLVALLIDQARLEEEKKDTASEYAKQIKGVKREIWQTAREIRERQEWREAQTTVDDMLAKRRTLAQE
jgi:hypothetical protein